MSRIVLAALVAATSLSPGIAGAQPVSAPACARGTLSLAVGTGNDGGTMHDTAYLALINTGDEACAVPGHPHVSFLNAAGGAVVADATTPTIRFMHPGPVIVPRTIAPGAALVTEIRWLRSNGDPASSACSTIARVSLESARAMFATTVCGLDTPVTPDSPDARPHVDVKPYGVAN